MNSSSLNKDGLLQEDNPLKLRVKALMMQRSREPLVLPTNTKVCTILLHCTLDGKWTLTDY